MYIGCDLLEELRWELVEAHDAGGVRGPASRGREAVFCEVSSCRRFCVIDD